jgi:hypothetical protein
MNYFINRLNNNISSTVQLKKSGHSIPYELQGTRMSNKIFAWHLTYTNYYNIYYTKSVF